MGSRSKEVWRRTGGRKWFEGQELGLQVLGYGGARFRLPRLAGFGYVLADFSYATSSIWVTRSQEFGYNSAGLWLRNLSRSSLYSEFTGDLESCFIEFMQETLSKHTNTLRQEIA